MKLLSRKGTVTVFEEASKNAIIIFFRERRFDLTKEQFNKAAETSHKGTMDDFIMCMVSYGITLDKQDLN